MDLSYNELKTGVIFGFLNTILHLSSKLKSHKFLFCWDSIHSIRKEMFSEYKSNRNRENLTIEEKQAIDMAYAQFDELREEILPNLGFNNIFVQNMMEADDLIAKISISHNMGESYIVSVDNDMYQLLNKVRGMYNPDKKKVYTELDFINQHEVYPNQWYKVKALTGDKSDNIPGVPGVGPITATKYVLNKPVSQKQLALIWRMKEEIELYERLVKLPHPRTKEIIINEDKTFNIRYFEFLCQKYGFMGFLKKEKYNEWKKSFGLI